MLEAAILYLLRHKPFYAHFLLNATVRYNDPKVKTAGVYVRSGVPVFVFDTNFLEPLTTNGRAAIIEHETLHLLFNHLVTMFKSKATAHQYLWNIAMDCAINQYIGELPEGCVTLELLAERLGEPLDPFETSQYYYDKLVQKPESFIDMNSFDEHGVSFDDADDPAMAAEGIKQATQKALRKAAGNAPDGVLKGLDSLPKPQLPWQHLLRNFVQSKAVPETRHTVKKTNRRFGIAQPGRIKKRALTVGVCVDSSGSVSDEVFKAFLSEVDVMRKQVSQLHLVDADAAVQDVQTLDRRKKLKVQRTGGGGTAYQPAISHCVKLKCDVIIYFGDFDSSDTPTDPKVPFLWVGSTDQDPPAPFGKVVRIKL